MCLDEGRGYAELILISAELPDAHALGVTAPLKSGGGRGAEVEGINGTVSDCTRNTPVQLDAFRIKASITLDPRLQHEGIK